MDWGDLGGANVFTNLTLTPGNTYTLTAATSQTINGEFHIRGNNCFPIVLQSSQEWSQATVYKPDGIVSGDFIYIRDIDANGQADFYGGGHSDDISNNSGWIWENAPDYIYGLRKDTTICEGDTLILDTDNFNTNPGTIIQWDDGTISPTYSVVDSGLYKVLVMYSDDCMVPDSIYVGLLPRPVIDLGNDTSICEGDEIQMQSSGDYVTYLWQDGSTTESIPANQSGMYWLEVSGENGCTNRDTVNIDVLEIPFINLGNDTTIRRDESIILNAGNPGCSYEWSTGESTQTIVGQGLDDGLEYWVIAENTVKQDNISKILFMLSQQCYIPFFLNHDAVKASCFQVKNIYFLFTISSR